MSTISTKRINDVLREVYASGEHVGWVTYIGTGWLFTAADRRFTNRFPDSAEPMSTWKSALPLED
jgi:hypothetical protein